MPVVTDWCTNIPSGVSFCENLTCLYTCAGQHQQCTPGRGLWAISRPRIGKRVLLNDALNA